MNGNRAKPSDSLLADLRRLSSQATISPRPWALIWNEGPAKHFDGSPAFGFAPIVSSFRIVDADRRLLVRFEADREQTLKVEDMQLIVEAINALPELLT